MSLFGVSKMHMVTAAEALPGRDEVMPVPVAHAVLGTPLAPPFPEDCETAAFALGCFWGAERKFWGLPGVWSTAVGYLAGFTRNPVYEEVCSGRTGHAEAVLVVFRSRELAYDTLLRVFWESHDPTQGMRQGNDVGTQYRSGIYAGSAAQLAAATDSRDRFQHRLRGAGFGAVTTEIAPMPAFYYAEPYHQQYLAKNPDGYCGLGGTGVRCE